MKALLKKCLSVNLESRTPDSKRFDLLIWPVKNKETVYIIEVKKKGSQSKEATINEGLSQIFEKNYSRNIIQRNKQLKTFIIRVAYFEMRNNLDWEFSIVELKFTRENFD